MPYKDKEVKKNSDKRWRESHPDYMKQYLRSWRENNPEKEAESQATYRLESKDKKEASRKLHSYRERALKAYGATCNRCGYSDIEEMLDVHHRDKNRKNSKLENLEVLCVWCHALETRGVVVQRENAAFARLMSRLLPSVLRR